MADFRYDPSSGRYRNAETGRFVTDASLRSAVDDVADLAADRLAELSASLRTGGVTLAEWQTEAMAIVKTSNVATGVVAHGGRAMMTPSDWGFIGIRIRTQYDYLRAFAADIAAETVPFDGRLDARARLYGQAARVMFEAMRARDDLARGLEEERNILHASESCAECRSETDRGYVPIGDLIPVGSRTCLANCRCTITRRMARAQSGVPYLRAV